MASYHHQHQLQPTQPPVYAEPAHGAVYSQPGALMPQHAYQQMPHQCQYYDCSIQEPHEHLDESHAQLLISVPKPVASPYNLNFAGTSDDDIDRSCVCRTDTEIREWAAERPWWKRTILGLGGATVLVDIIGWIVFAFVMRGIGDGLAIKDMIRSSGIVVYTFSLVVALLNVLSCFVLGLTFRAIAFLTPAIIVVEIVLTVMFGLAHDFGDLTIGIALVLLQIAICVLVFMILRLRCR